MVEVAVVVAEGVVVGGDGGNKPRVRWDNAALRLRAGVKFVLARSCATKLASTERSEATGIVSSTHCHCNELVKVIKPFKIVHRYLKLLSTNNCTNFIIGGTLPF